MIRPPPIRPTAMRPLAALALAALLAPLPAAAEISATDSTGREVALPEPPERVVALYNEAFGMLATLGVRPVGAQANPEMLADEAYYFEDGESIAPAGAADGGVDAERVAALGPDLIVGWGGEDRALLSGIAPFFDTGGVETEADAREALRALARLLGVPERAEEAIETFEARVAAYAARAPERPTVLKLGVQAPGRFAIATRGDPACGLLDRVAACDWPGEGPGAWSYQAGAEAVLALDPDVIVLGNWSEMDDASLAAALEADPLWGEIRAVREGRVVSVPGYSNPIFSSIAAGEKLLDTLVPAIFPDAFPDGPLSEAEVAEALEQE